MASYSLATCLSITSLLLIIVSLDYTQQAALGEQDNSNATIRLTHAVEDFKRLIYKDKYSEVYDKMGKAVIKMINCSQNSMYNSMQALKVLREYCVPKDCDHYNKLMYQLKPILQQQRNYNFWNEIVAGNLGLITEKETLFGYCETKADEGDKFLQYLIENEFSQPSDSDAATVTSPTEDNAGSSSHGQVNEIVEHNDSAKFTHKIGLSNPSEDIYYLCEHGAHFHKLFFEMIEVIKELLQRSPDCTEVPIKALKTLRFMCIQKRSDVYNGWMYMLKKILQKQNNIKFWNAIVAEKLGLITNVEEAMYGKTTNEMAEKFLQSLFESEDQLDKSSTVEPTSSLQTTINWSSETESYERDSYANM